MTRLVGARELAQVSVMNWRSRGLGGLANYAMLDGEDAFPSVQELVRYPDLSDVRRAIAGL